jgi:hypothetical protein
LHFLVSIALNHAPVSLGWGPQRPRLKPEGGGKTKCFNCGEEGHFSWNCPAQKKESKARKKPSEETEE